MDKDYAFDHELSDEEFLNSNDVTIEKVPTPEIRQGSFVYVRSLMADQRGLIEEKGVKYKEKLSKGKDDSYARDFTTLFAFLCMCNADGTPKYTDIKIVAQLKKKNAGMIARIAERGQALSGFTKQDMEQLEKNLPEAQPGDSPSD